MNSPLNFIEAGSGEPLVLLHGNGESSEYFQNQIDFLIDSPRLSVPFLTSVPSAGESYYL